MEPYFWLYRDERLDEDMTFIPNEDSYETSLWDDKEGEILIYW